MIYLQVHKRPVDDDRPTVKMPVAAVAVLVEQTLPQSERPTVEMPAVRAEEEG